jgi:hypothetical protein
MMIRSQDRKKLYPLTKGLYYDGGVSIMMDLGFSVDGTGDLLLGKYESKSRCLAILDEIQKMFSQYVEVRNGRVPFNFLDWPKVYEMPEK